MSRVLVTGSDGYIGQAVMAQLDNPVAFDLPTFDILNTDHVAWAARHADACIHLAAHKYATTAEDHPAKVTELNVQGTQNVIDAFGPNTVVASTCKAADAMTVYGASKLIAERIALNAHAKVVRFVNVLNSTGSVLPYWRSLPEADPIPVTDCTRMWMTKGQAATLAVNALDWPSGRYALANPVSVHMSRMAATEHPDRQTTPMPLRRGDRPAERLLGEYEQSTIHEDGTIQIDHLADHPQQTEAIAA